MSDNIIPKAENAGKGFHYTVTDEQIKQHQQRTFLEIFEWLEETNKFIYSIQTDEERKRIKETKHT